MNKELLGRRGFWVLRSRACLGWPVKIPVLVLGFGRGKVKVEATLFEGGTRVCFVPEKHLQIRTAFGRPNRTYRCKHAGCPAKYVNPYSLEGHEAKRHVRCSCGRHFLPEGLNKHRSWFKRRGIQHP